MEWRSITCFWAQPLIAIASRSTPIGPSRRERWESRLCGLPITRFHSMRIRNRVRRNLVRKAILERLQNRSSIIPQFPDGFRKLLSDFRSLSCSFGGYHNTLDVNSLFGTSILRSCKREQAIAGCATRGWVAGHAVRSSVRFRGSPPMR